MGVVGAHYGDDGSASRLAVHVVAHVGPPLRLRNCSQEPRVGVPYIIYKVQDTS